ncbi:unnamed protein product [Meganyctiphanes norvegica]|uniref:Oplophorus-luciferin 2-monooxygenase non-catalytic subunit n=1 Tax=Meganyctiphanes norvegica TaxID=48144 RepID=A0AAV2QD52_MEGNR
MIQHAVFLFATGAALLGFCEASSAFPCPPEGQILPCVCSLTDDTMELDCSAVQDETQLKEIFHTTPPFPFTHFTKFVMDNNQHVVKLENGVFNYITFDEIWITNGALKEMEQGSVEQSKGTLTKMVLHGNQIERFLMEDEPDMTAFIAFEFLNLNGNQVKVFPDIKSTTLKTFYINHNPITLIHNENLFRVPNLEDIDISDIGLIILETKLLSNHKKLQHINLSNNKLSIIQNTALIIQSPDLKDIDLSNNIIDDVEPGAFDTNNNGLTLNLEKNLLYTLNEDTWKPLIQAGVYLKLSDNAFGCGCDMKWAVAPPAGDNTDYISAMDGTCSSGNSFSSLDPDWYTNFC